MKESVLTSHEASITSKNISTVTLLKMGQYPFLVASVMLIPRLMGPVVYGEYALLISLITMIASLIDFGGGTDIFGRFVPEFEVRGDSVNIRKLTANVLTLKGGIDLITLVVLFPVLYFLYSDRFPHAYFFLVAGIVLVRDIQTLPYALLFGSNRLVKFSSAEPMRRVMSLFFILILFHYFGLLGAVLSTLVVECVLGSCAFFWAREYFSFDNLGIDLNFLKPYLRFHFIFYVSSFTLNMWQRLGNPIIEYLTEDPKQVALFDIPNQIFLITGTFALVIIASLIPIFSKFVVVGKEDKIVAWARLVMKYIGILCTMTFGGFLLVGPDLIPVIIGAAYRDIFPNGVVLLLGLYPMSVVHLGQVFSVVYKKPGKYFQALCLGIVTFSVISILLVPKYSSMGCAIGSVSSCVAVTIFMAISFGWKLVSCLTDGLKTIGLSLVFSPLLLFRGSFLATNFFLLVGFSLGYLLLLFATRILTWHEITEVLTAIRHKPDSEAPVEPTAASSN